jgi:hypothetical protein
MGIRKDISWKLLDQAVIQDNTGAIVYNLAQQDMVAMRMTMRAGWQVSNAINYDQAVEASRYPAAVLRQAVDPPLVPQPARQRRAARRPTPTTPGREAPWRTPRRTTPARPRRRRRPTRPRRRATSAPRSTRCPTAPTRCESGPDAPPVHEAQRNVDIADDRPGGLTCPTPPRSASCTTTLRPSRPARLRPDPRRGPVRGHPHVCRSRRGRDHGRQHRQAHVHARQQGQAGNGTTVIATLDFVTRRQRRRVRREAVHALGHVAANGRSPAATSSPSSRHVAGTGLANPGGLVQVEITSS